MSPLITARRPVTPLQAVWAGALIAAILLGGVFVAWFTNEMQRSALDLLIAGRLIGL